MRIVEFHVQAAVIGTQVHWEIECLRCRQITHGIGGPAVDRRPHEGHYYDLPQRAWMPHVVIDATQDFMVNHKCVRSG